MNRQGADLCRDSVAPLSAGTSTLARTGRQAARPMGRTETKMPYAPWGLDTLAAYREPMPLNW